MRNHNLSDAETHKFIMIKSDQIKSLAAIPVDIHKFLTLEKYSTEFSTLHGDYIFAHALPGIANEDIYPGHPVRVKGLTILLCVKGTIEADINLTPYTIGPGMLMLVSHDNIFHVKKVDVENLDVYMIVMSPEFIRDINIDMAVLQTIKISPDAEPVLKLDEEEERIIRSYMEMIHTNTTVNTEPVYVRSISRCLMAAVVYQLIQMGRNRTKAEPPATPGIARRNNYVRDFIKLVHEYHTRERSVSFYASKLFISSKYLSTLVREASGRSAAEWIDQYVILEAKNQLRFSGKNIQQIAYDLNFSNQSAFGKYFKHLTGMSPSEFQRL